MFELYNMKHRKGEFALGIGLTDTLMKTGLL